VSSIPEAININLSGLSDLNQLKGLNMKIGNVFEMQKDFLTTVYKPTFDTINSFDISFVDFMKNPYNASYLFITSFIDYTMGSVSNTTIVKNLNRSLDFVTTETNKLLDSTSQDTYIQKRLENLEGRNDDILNINANYIADKSILKDKKLPDINTVINIGRPKDIKWTLSLNDYYDKDYIKLPESLLNKKNMDGISLNDKKDIIIPYIVNGDYYELSCSDAYFKNNVNEKANLLKDNVNKPGTCSYNIDEKTVKFEEEKKRYVNTRDLSNFL